MVDTSSGQRTTTADGLGCRPMNATATVATIRRHARPGVQPAGALQQKQPSLTLGHEDERVQAAEGSASPTWGVPRSVACVIQQQDTGKKTTYRERDAAERFAQWHADADARTQQQVLLAWHAWRDAWFATMMVAGGGEQHGATQPENAEVARLRAGLPAGSPGARALLKPALPANGNATNTSGEGAERPSATSLPAIERVIEREATTRLQGETIAATARHNDGQDSPAARWHAAELVAAPRSSPTRTTPGDARRYNAGPSRPRPRNDSWRTRRQVRCIAQRLFSGRPSGCRHGGSARSTGRTRWNRAARCFRCRRRFCHAESASPTWGVPRCRAEPQGRRIAMTRARTWPGWGAETAHRHHTTDEAPSSNTRPTRWKRVLGRHRTPPHRWPTKTPPVGPPEAAASGPPGDVRHPGQGQTDRGVANGTAGEYAARQATGAPGPTWPTTTRRRRARVSAGTSRAHRRPLLRCTPDRPT